MGQAQEFLRVPAGARSETRLAVLGDLALDRYVCGSVDRISPEAPVPVLLVDRKFNKPGCAANVVENLAALARDWNLSVDVFGLVGEDEAGDSLLAQMRSLGPAINVQVERSRLRPTTVKTRYMAGTQHQLLRVDEEDASPIEAEFLRELMTRVEARLPAIKGLIIEDYAKGLLSESLLRRVIESAKKHKVQVFIDPNIKSPAALYRGATLLTPNIAESEALLGRHFQSKGKDDAEIGDACRELVEKLDLQMVMITRGKHGISLLDSSKRLHHFPAIARAVYDVTGAGDTVVAVVAAALLGGASAEVACTLATAAASVVVAKVGAATAKVEEISQELTQLNVSDSSGAS